MVERCSGALEVECLSVYGNSVKGIWRESSLARDPEGNAEEALDGHIFL